MLTTSRSLSEAAVGVMELALLVLALVSHQYLIQKSPILSVLILALAFLK